MIYKLKYGRNFTFLRLDDKQLYASITFVLKGLYQLECDS